MDSEAMSSKPMHPLLALLLTAAAICLFGPLLLLALVSGQGGYSAAVAVVELAMVACPMGAIMLIVYDVLDKPWKRPFPRSWFFWLQVLAIGMIGMSVASGFLEDWQRERQQAWDYEEEQRAKEPRGVMQAALSHDDDASFAKAYKICGKSCLRGEWLPKAIVAQAPRILGVLLEGATKRTYEKEFLNTAYLMGICKEGAYYEGYFALPGRAGASGNMAVIERFLPQWDRDQVQEAFAGAAFGNHIDTMRALIAHGANPHQPMNENPPPQVAYDSVTSAAVRSGAIDALRWLGEQGVRVGSDNEQDQIWTSFDEWIEHSPSAVWIGQLEAMLDALARLGAVPAHNSHGGSLGRAAGAGDALLAHALLRHGAVVESIDDDDLRAALQALLKRPPDQLGWDDGTRILLCHDDSAPD
ncbi:hypothetical protein HB780_01850 (plasmid) [Rhizobium lusitanum]|uniref:hypothetical protein n=1 Tax=Rhizobium lusitanum TaxID=293958 RepID=UPI0016072189|nr:hypothetical protein [Rhizobium lusitanum]QND44573.1 hypothetical protein HB780_01850 [Rhizobium lusitanum]